MPAGGAAQVVAYGSPGKVHCEIASFAESDTGKTINVNCTDGLGNFIDAGFELQFER